MTYLTRERERERQHIYEEVLGQVVVIQPTVVRAIFPVVRHVEHTLLFEARTALCGPPSDIPPPHTLPGFWCRGVAHARVRDFWSPFQ